MTGLSRERAARLADLLRTELELFTQYRDQTAAQEEHLAANDVDSFTNSISIRQKLIDEINGLHQEKDLLMQSYVSVSNEGKSGELAEIERLRGQTHVLMNEISKMDAKNLEKANAVSEQYSEELKRLTETRQGFSAYKQSITYSGDLYDRKS